MHKLSNTVFKANTADNSRFLKLQNPKDYVNIKKIKTAWQEIEEKHNLEQNR